MVQGSVIGQLRERCGLRQAGLADRLGVTTSMMSRVELGRARVDTVALRKLARALKIDEAAFLRIVDEALKHTEQTARRTLKGLGTAWAEDVSARVGGTGLAALVTFAVAAVISQEIQK